MIHPNIIGRSIRTAGVSTVPSRPVHIAEGHGAICLVVRLSFRARGQRVEKVSHSAISIELSTTTMIPGTTAIERAFELAKSGQFGSISEIKKKLNSEGFSGDQVSGRELSRQLSKLMVESGGKAPPATGSNR